MIKTTLMLFCLIILSACSKPDTKEKEPSIYKKAIDDSRQIQINMDKEAEINYEAIK